jgi:hypothetical protein
MGAQYNHNPGGFTTAPQAKRLAVGLLTTVEDFDAMRGHSTFEFTNYEFYLAEHVRLLESLRAEGRLIRVGRFDPCDYLNFCSSARLDPDSVNNRARYVQDVCVGDPQLPDYTGQPLAEIIAELETDRRHQTLLRILFDLLEDSVREEKHPLRAMLHAEGHAASTFAAIVNDAGQGQHVLVLSTVGESGEQATVAFEFAISGEQLTLSKRRVIDALLTLYALCYVNRVPATITLRSTPPADPPRRPLRIWRLADRRVLPVEPPVDYTLPAAPSAGLAKD